MSETLKILFRESISDFFEVEARNITGGTSERNLCCRLAMIIEKKMKECGIYGYYADTEYNRMRYDKVKKIWIDARPQSVCCDLIVHSRGEIPEDDNLIAIEMKKSTRSSIELESDKSRLKSMTNNHGDQSLEYVYGYKIGFFINLYIEHSRYEIEEFQRGQSVQICKGCF